jgi:hypothetical protein
MWNQIGNRFSIATDNDRFAVPFQLGEQAGKVRFCLMNINKLHWRQLVHPVQLVNEESKSTQDQGPSNRPKTSLAPDFIGDILSAWIGFLINMRIGTFSRSRFFFMARAWFIRFFSGVKASARMTA